MQARYGADVATGTISAITDTIIPVVKNGTSVLWIASIRLWRDAIHYKIPESRYESKAVYTLNLEGKKAMLGLYLSASEGANCWLSVLTDLNNRGVEDILIASRWIEGLP